MIEAYSFIVRLLKIILNGFIPESGKDEEEYQEHTFFTLALSLEASL